MKGGHPHITKNLNIWKKKMTTSNTQSENIIEVIKALVLVQAEMEPASKDSTNPFHKSKYADLSSVVSACRTLLAKNNLCTIQTTKIDGEKTILITTLAHTSGQWISSEIALNPVKNDPQGVGAAMTYLRRYSLMALVGVVTEDDDGEIAMGRKPDDKKKPDVKIHQQKPDIVIDQKEDFGPKIDAQQEIKFQDHECRLPSEKKEIMWNRLKTKYNVHAAKDIPISAFEEMINWMKLNIANQTKAVE